MKRFDVAIIGSGIAGASAAYEIAGTQNVLVLEAESHHGYHTTGRSAALFTEAYGNDVIRALTVGGRPFLQSPPQGFVDGALLSRRGVLLIARPDQMPQAIAEERRSRALVPSIRLIAASEVRRMVPILRPDYVAGAVLEPEAMDIDVHALHQGFLRGARARGAEIRTEAQVIALEPLSGRWRLVTRGGPYEATMIVNAAGAWADQVGSLAGAKTIGLVPKRRTALVVQPPAGHAVERWPTVLDIDESFYFKPDAGRLLASPADETPMAPCDAQPDEMDVALAIDRIQRVADLPVRRVEKSWAGLRCFVSDKTPVVGFDSRIEGFFWLAGQGGYGIQTSPALGRVAAHLVNGKDLPPDIRALGVSTAALAPQRLQAQSAAEAAQ
jgi:D-arginine dehydrogenase